MKTNLLSKVQGSKLTRSLGKGVKTVKKHSPLILQVAGGVGFIATAYTAYKAQPRVAEIVVDMEEQRALEERYIELVGISVADLTDEEVVELHDIREEGMYEFNRWEYACRIAGAVALPVCLGIASVASIAFAYKIMSGRIFSLTGAVSALTAEKLETERRLKEQLDEDTFTRVMRPSVDHEEEILGDDGKSRLVKGEVKEVGVTTSGAWFSESSEFASDDHSYNMQYVSHAQERIEHKLATRGHVLLNELYDALGLPRTAAGATLGWDFGDDFDIAIDLITTFEEGKSVPDIYLKWKQPRPIYEDVEYEGRYSVLN